MLRAHPYALFDASISLQVPIFSSQMFHDAPKSVNYLCQTGYGIDVMDLYLMDRSQKRKIGKKF